LKIFININIAAAVINIDRAVGAKFFAFLSSKTAVLSINAQKISICQTVKCDEVGKWQNV